MSSFDVNRNQRLGQTNPKSTKALARELRRQTDGKFGDMEANRWNDRIIGTKGSYRAVPYTPKES